LGEEGLDAGGLTKEFYLVLSRAIFNPNYALFKASSGNANVFQPNRFSYINSDHLLFFKFVGRFVGKALLDQQRMDAYFTRSFYKHILNIPPSIHDLEYVDPDYYKRSVLPSFLLV
jgi:E3 ubiquitin-protein ligase HUWE1